VPPDLTTPQQTTNASLFSATLQKASKEEKAQYQQYQQFQRMAEYEEFLQWRKDQSGDEELNIADFRAAQSVLLKTSLIDKGVLVVTGDAGERIVLIADTFDSSWNRVDTALRNLNIQIGGSNRREGYFWFYYDTDNDQKPKGWLQWAFWMEKSPIYTLLLKSEDHGVSAALYDEKTTPLTTPVAEALIQRLSVQLLTFVARQQPAAVNTPVATIQLVELSDGRLQILLPGTTDVAWHQLASILHDAGFTLTQRDPGAHLFRIRYDTNTLHERKGLLQKLTFWKKNDTVKTPELYDIQLTGNGQTTLVDVWDQNRQRTATGDAILKIVLDHLTN